MQNESLIQKCVAVQPGQPRFGTTTWLYTWRAHTASPKLPHSSYHYYQCQRLWSAIFPNLQLLFSTATPARARRRGPLNRFARCAFAHSHSTFYTPMRLHRLALFAFNIICVRASVVMRPTAPVRDSRTPSPR